MKFDDLVNSVLNENVLTEKFEQPYGSVSGTGDKKEAEIIIKGLKMIKAATKPTENKSGRPAGAKIVDQALYDTAMKYFRKLGESGGIIAWDDDENSNLAAAIYANISNDNIGYKIFDQIYDAWDEGFTAGNKKREKKENKRLEKYAAKKMKKDGSDPSNPKNWVQDDSDDDLVFSYNGSAPKGQKWTRGGAWNG